MRRYNSLAFALLTQTGFPLTVGSQKQMSFPNYEMFVQCRIKRPPCCQLNCCKTIETILWYIKKQRWFWATNYHWETKLYAVYILMKLMYGVMEITFKASALMDLKVIPRWHASWCLRRCVHWQLETFHMTQYILVAEGNQVNYKWKIGILYLVALQMDDLRLEMVYWNGCVLLEKASCPKEVQRFAETPWKGTEFPVQFSHHLIRNHQSIILYIL